MKCGTSPGCSPFWPPCQIQREWKLFVVFHEAPSRHHVDLSARAWFWCAFVSFPRNLPPRKLNFSIKSPPKQSSDNGNWKLNQTEMLAEPGHGALFGKLIMFDRNWRASHELPRKLLGVQRRCGFWGATTRVVDARLSLQRRRRRRALVIEFEASIEKCFPPIYWWYLKCNRTRWRKPPAFAHCRGNLELWWNLVWRLVLAGKWAGIVRIGSIEEMGFSS